MSDDAMYLPYYRNGHPIRSEGGSLCWYENAERALAHARDVGGYVRRWEPVARIDDLRGGDA